MASPYQGSVTAAQDVLNASVVALTQLGLPSLGPCFQDLSGTSLADALVVHRMTKKFAKPGQADSLRRTSSINSMLAYDANGPSRVPALKDIPQPYRRTLLLARQWLADTLRGFRVSHTVRFPSGESHSSMKGWVDVVAKLADDSAWEVSLRCVTAASKICYNNVQLKRAVKHRFRSEFPLDKRPAGWYQEAVEKNKHVGFYVFTRMFLACCNIVGTSRVTTVPKDNSADRVITCEPFWNMVVQLSLATDLRACLRSIGINLETAQDLHRGLIAHEGSATIDFSNASNSNWLCWLRFLWPPSVLAHIENARTGLFEVDVGSSVEYHPVKMLAPMGCGFTFEVMTLTLFAISRVLDKSSRVFGDDVILGRESAQGFMDVMSYIGWQVNSKKTFVEGNFRESCGGFYSLADRHHIVCYDFVYPETLPDVFVLIQKLEKIIGARQISNGLSCTLSSLLVSLLRIIPRDAFVEPRSVFADDCCPTRLVDYFRQESRETIYEQVLQSFQWDNTSLYASYHYRMSRRDVSVAESVFSVVASFYSMRAHSYVHSRNREDKLTRQTMVDGAAIPLSEVGWFSVII